MSYNYNNERPFIFTEDGQVMFLKIRDQIKYLLRTAGAVRMEEALRGCIGSSWHMLACVDRLVELGELKELTAPDSVMGQFRVFVENYR